MPWQQYVADVGLELDEDGVFCYREVILSVPRQNGKTALIHPVKLDRCISWSTPQRVIYTAQTGMDARKKMLEDEVPVLEASPLHGLVRNIYRAAGQEAIVWKNGSRISLTASARESGHGFTLDLGVLDECWNDVDDRREQAMLPAMNTRQMAQMWLTSTMGTEASIYLNRKVEAGRHAVANDKGSGVAYFEWSIPLESDITDPSVWWEHMPALGWTISENAVAHALQTMEESEWRRAYGNQMTAGQHDRIIPETLWQAVCQPNIEVARDKPVVFAVDILPDRTYGAIVASDGEHIELVDHRPGTGWIVERMKTLWQTWSCEFVLDGGGPAGSIALDLKAEGIDVQQLQTAEVAAACASIYDAIADHAVKFRTDGALDKAVAGVQRRPIGDRFIWSRQTSLADITPFMAATLAYGKARLAPSVSFIAFD
jgi:hypothetical protein